MMMHDEADYVIPEKSQSRLQIVADSAASTAHDCNLRVECS